MTATKSDQITAADARTGEVTEVSDCDTPPVSASLVRVAVLDDHTMVRQGLVSELESVAGNEIQVVISAGSWTDLIAHPAYPVAVVLFDLDLGDGAPATPKIAMLRNSGAAVIIVSQYADPARVRECLAAGAVGYVPKTGSSEELVAAIRAAAAGEEYLTKTVAEMLAVDHASWAVDGLSRPKLSRKEIDALVLYASGLPMKSVARQMHIEPDTAKGYIDRVREKYAKAGREARTKLELRQRAIQDGYIAGD
jgi:DNA-binding NarL/FixJ family response regulator